MATLYWNPTASAVAQVGTVQITAVSGTPSDTTYAVIMGGASVSVVGDTDVNTTAANLNTALNASLQPYFASITWTVSTDTVTATADTAGEPFTITTSETGGTGTIGDYVAVTANASPNDFADASNWDTGVAPANTDVVIVKNSSVDILWGLAQSGVALTSLTIEKSFTGVVGLRPDAFYSAGAADLTVPEYRAIYLDIGATDIDIGEHNGPGDPDGSVRINIDNPTTTSECRIHDTADGGESSNPAVAYIAAHANSDVEVRNAPGGVGLTTLVPAETGTYGNVYVVAENSTTRVYVGPGATITNYSQNQGDNQINPATDITLITVDGGELLVDGGDYTVTTFTINAGTVTDKHVDTGAVIGTLNMNGGSIDLTGSGAARTITTCNFKDGEMQMDDDDITISSSFIGTATGKRSITVESGV